MSDGNAFRELLDRVRAGDEQAAADLVKRFEPAIRRAVRVRLVDERLGRVFDSMDVCQSVMASFFMRAALGQYDLNSPEQLLKLLARMARNKLADRVDHERAARRDQRRVEHGAADSRELPGATATPSRQLAARELLDEAQRRFSPEERQLVELRAQGLEWSEIAQRLGSTPEALRKRLGRATDRIAQELGIDETSHE